MLTVDFGVDLDDETELREADLPARLAACADELRDDLHLYGHLHVTGDGVDLDLEDELVPMVARLCFGAIPGLLARQLVTLDYWAYNGALRLEPGDHQRVRIAGDGVAAPVEIAVADLARGLYECGARVVALLTEVGHDATRIAALADAGGQARRALADAGLEPLA